MIHVYIINYDLLDRLNWIKICMFHRMLIREWLDNSVLCWKSFYHSSYDIHVNIVSEILGMLLEGRGGCISIRQAIYNTNFTKGGRF